MLIATKHNTDNNFCLSVRQRTRTLVLVCYIVQTSQLHLLTYDLNSPDVIGKPTD